MSKQGRKKGEVKEETRAKKAKKKRETKSLEGRRDEKLVEITPPPKSQIFIQTISRSPRELERIKLKKNELDPFEEVSEPIPEPLQIPQIRVKNGRKKQKIEEKRKGLSENEMPPVKLEVSKKYKLRRSSDVQPKIKKSVESQNGEETESPPSKEYAIHPPQLDVAPFAGGESENPVTQQTDITKVSQGQEKISLEIPDFMEKLLGKSAAETISKNGPFCIIVPKNERRRLDQLLGVICRDVYREREGGKPTPLFRKNMEELRTELEPEWEGEIVIVEEVEGNSERLIQTLEGFFALGTGFLILVSEDPMKLEDKILKEIPTSGLPLSRVEGVDISHDTEVELIKMIRGRLPTRFSRIFGVALMEAVTEFESELIDQYLSYEKLPAPLMERYDDLTTRSPNNIEQAGELHSAMKGFVWVYEWKKHEEKIIPQLETKEEAADVKIESKRYEIETLFGVGDPLSKLTKKINKYKYRVWSDTEVRFVMRNFDILRHLRKLLIFRNRWRKKGVNMEIFGLNLQGLKLIPIGEFKEFVTKFGEI